MNKTAKFFIWIAVGLAALRLLSLPFTPLTDTTEARYAEIGRVMAESGNYITPFVDGVPFWGKPPLSFWTTAISYKIFGVNDFAAHFPHFLFLIGAAALLFFFVRRWRDESTAAITTAVLMTMPVFLYLAGGVMTDPALAFCMMLAMIGFYNAVNNKNIAPERSTGGWGYLFFVGLGLGLLAKGPLIFVLVGLPIFVYVLAKNKWRNMFRNVPIVTGTLLMLAIALPWYIMAERATPGFLEYFIIGEHFERYVTPNWAGDLYGAGRGGFIGKIWLVYFIAIMPWSIWLAVKMFSARFRRAITDAGFFRDGFLFYALAFTFAQLIFFSFSKNIVPAYVLPAMIPTAILIAAMPVNRITFKWFAGIAATALIGIIAVQAIYPKWTADAGFSDKYFIRNASEQITLYKTQNYSAQFYTAARGIKYEFATDTDGLDGYVLLRNRHLHELENYDVITSGKKMILVKINDK